jgi:organic radical activating enzyme
LHCVWCDTPYTWNWNYTDFAHPDKYDREKETHRLPIHEIINRLLGLGGNTMTLVISGGEPFLQQHRLLPLVRELYARGWWMEIETNGTIMPKRPGLFDLLNLVNCSPKLSNSGDPEHLRIKPSVLKALAIDNKVSFKFVVGDVGDVYEIKHLVSTYGMRNVWIMPMGRTREELEESTPIARYLANKEGYRFSPRLHIEQYGDKRGV